MGSDVAMQKWLRCSIDTYKAERKLMTFDRAALEAAWSGCNEHRDAVVSATPIDQRNLISRMLEGIHDSVIAEIVAQDNQLPGYGLNRNRPVKVGGGWQEGVRRSLEYLGQLQGENSEVPTITRIGSCCAFSTPNAQQGRQGRLEVYDLTFKQWGRAKIVYVNTYDEDDLDVVDGLERAKVAERDESEPVHD